ncbi:hypothetical protein FG379_003188 [Cryptosporidium bovis]|uniref:uncharacterized protein n=1 Tax=Cryptosporidium bovis TaxID=310047 RepID=UPI00351A5A9E|nr:hypothetical protein FG379_003188 [Cryptosporidium bovis]
MKQMKAKPLSEVLPTESLFSSDAIFERRRSSSSRGRYKSRSSLRLRTKSRSRSRALTRRTSPSILAPEIEHKDDDAGVSHDTELTPVITAHSCDQSFNFGDSKPSLFENND